ncbi:MAG: hypothetical protein JNK82_24940 [Myxococcaceae bacterium]|nr:hypothetical protein [Myxococcaceae bacterium]
MGHDGNTPDVTEAHDAAGLAAVSLFRQRRVTDNVSKLLLMASMWVIILVPLLASRKRDALKGFKGAFAISLTFNLVWTIVLLALFSSRVDEPQTLLPETTELEMEP